MVPKNVSIDCLNRLGFTGGLARAGGGSQYAAWESRPSPDGARLKVFINEYGEDWTIDVDGDFDIEVETPSGELEVAAAMNFLKIPKGAM